ncbi:MAG TPA: DUF1146 family protein [Pseudogracilibacillus sp.]|nr:DUF1146 family protein [Pseudogracilibacillus sp.]
MKTIGFFSLIGMLSHVMFIYITWLVIQSVNFDQFFHTNKVVEARLLIIFITIAIGTAVSRFVLDIIQWSQDLIYLF